MSSIAVATGFTNIANSWIKQILDNETTPQTLKLSLNGYTLELTIRHEEDESEEEEVYEDEIEEEDDDTYLEFYENWRKPNEKELLDASFLNNIATKDKIVTRKLFKDSPLNKLIQEVEKPKNEDEFADMPDLLDEHENVVVVNPNGPQGPNDDLEAQMDVLKEVD